MYIFAAARGVPSLLELDELGADLCTGDRRIRLSERHDRCNKGSGNYNGLNKGLHGYYLQTLLFRFSSVEPLRRAGTPSSFLAELPGNANRYIR
jgi:hypothetical protein